MDHPTAPVLTFRAVYDQYFDFVWASVRRLGIPIEAVDDLVQEVFLVVHARIGTVEHPASLKSWLYGVVRRTVSTHNRVRNARVAREARSALDDSAGPKPPTPLDVALASEEHRLLWRLLAELAPLKREILMLVEIEEMTVPEVAEAIGVPLNTAYSRLRAARHEFNEVVIRDEDKHRTRG